MILAACSWVLSFSLVAPSQGDDAPSGVPAEDETGVAPEGEGPPPADPPATEDASSRTSEVAAPAEPTMEDIFGNPSVGAEEAEPPSGEPAVVAGPEVPRADPPPPASPGEPTMDDIFGDPSVRPSEAAVHAEASPPSAIAPTKDRDRPRRPRLRSRDDLHFSLRLLSSVYFAVAKTDDPGLERNENRLEFRLSYAPNRRIELVGDIEAVFFGASQATDLGGLTRSGTVSPFHLESDAAYVAIYDLLPNLDVKLGRQIVRWGTADQFNPTNNINADDLEDRPLFTEPIANQMLVIDWAPLDDRLYFQGVYVPLFTPALLPPSATDALLDPYGPVPFADQADLDAIDAARALFEIDPGLIPTITSQVDSRRLKFSDGQAAFKVGTNLGGVFDLSASYYYGLHDIPTPVDVQSAFKQDATGEPGTPECCVDSVVRLKYPRMQVVGLDFSTQLPFLDNLGLWGEAALFIPQPEDLFIGFPRPQDVTPDDGINNPVTSIAGPTIESTPYVKATAGIDYTIGKHVYLQGQYLRGFIDEIGAAHIGNYLVAGTELSFLGRHLLVRLFGVVDFPTGRGDEGSYVIYPALMAKPKWGYVTIELGSFFLLGGPDTKFGQKATGSSIVFAKAIGQF